MVCVEKSAAISPVEKLPPEKLGQIAYKADQDHQGRIDVDSIYRKLSDSGWITPNERVSLYTLNKERLINEEYRNKIDIINIQEELRKVEADSVNLSAKFMQEILVNVQQ